MRKQSGLKNWNVANGGLDGSNATIKVGNAYVRKRSSNYLSQVRLKGTLGLAFGYGKKAGLKEEMQVGVNAYALYANLNSNQSATITLAEGD